MDNEFMTRLKDSQDEQKRFLESEEHQKELWDAREKRWYLKAKKEGREYTPRPFVTSAEKKAQEEFKRQKRIEELKGELRELLNEQEKDALFARLKSDQI